MENIKSIEKPSYDARKGFAELLIKILERCVDASTLMGDLPAWEMYLRHYHSLTMRFIREEDETTIKQLMDKIDDMKYTLRNGHRMVSNYTQNNSTYMSNSPTLLMKLQEVMVSATSHLLVPTKESEDEDFDPQKWIE